MRFIADMSLLPDVDSNRCLNFAFIVITTGERLFSSGIAADIFEMKTLAAYARLNEERHDILLNIFQRGTVYAPRMTELI